MLTLFENSPSLSDWIGYFKRSRSDDSKSYYAYQKTGGSEKGKLEFVVPSKLGMCEVRMFQNNDYKLVARSKPIRVGNSVQMRAELRDGLVHVVVMYADAKTRSSWDWVGLYAVGERDNGAHGGRYTYVSKDTVTLPAPKKPGSYVVRYFQSGSGLSELAESAPLAIADNDSVTVAVAGTEATVSWHIESVPNSSKDRIGVFKEGVFNPLVPVAMQQTHSNKADGVAKVRMFQSDFFLFDECPQSSLCPRRRDGTSLCLSATAHPTASRRVRLSKSSEKICFTVFVLPFFVVATWSCVVATWRGRARRCSCPLLVPRRPKACIMPIFGPFRATLTTCRLRWFLCRPLRCWGRWAV